MVMILFLITYANGCNDNGGVGRSKRVGCKVYAGGHNVPDGWQASKRVRERVPQQLWVLQFVDIEVGNIHDGHGDFDGVGHQPANWQKEARHRELLR